jgi:hypothetical protein
MAIDNNHIQTASLMGRSAIFTQAEAFVLHHLLIDDNESPEDEGSRNILNDDILFTVPVNSREYSHGERSSVHWLWRAHGDGVNLRKNTQRVAVSDKGRLLPNEKVERRKDPLQSSALLPCCDGPKQTAKLSDAFDLAGSSHSQPILVPKEVDIRSIKAVDDSDAPIGSEFCNDDDGNISNDVLSDARVRPINSKSDVSETSSWDENEHEEHFDTWEVLKNEYSQDFGFDYNAAGWEVDDDDDDQQPNHGFMILGTSADDASAQPHVVSPPLMDALMNFVPERVWSENYWLKVCC